MSFLKSCLGFFGWVGVGVGSLYSDVISPDNGLVKAGILQAPSSFDCEGQLWRNGHYLPVSSSMKRSPPPPPSFSSTFAALCYGSHRGRDMTGSHTGLEKLLWFTHSGKRLQEEEQVAVFTASFSHLEKCKSHAALLSKLKGFFLTLFLF